MSTDAYRRTTYQGETLNYRTLEMFERARRRFGFAVTISQGSYKADEPGGGAPQSAGTHDGGGVLDVGGTALTSAQRKTVETELRRVGFAAWVRDPSQGDWPYHIHAVAVADHELSAAARAQVVAYNNGRNGLASNGPDTGTRQFVGTVYPQELDVSFYGPEHWDEADWDRYEEKAGWKYNMVDGRGTLRNADKLLAMVHTNGYEAEDEAKAAKLAAVSASNQAAAAQTAAGAAQAAAEATQQTVNALAVKLFPPA